MAEEEREKKRRVDCDEKPAKRPRQSVIVLNPQFLRELDLEEIGENQFKDDDYELNIQYGTEAKYEKLDKNEYIESQLNEIKSILKRGLKL